MSKKQKKYTAEFKIKVAKAYLSGKYGGRYCVATKFGVANSRPYYWLKQLREEGEESFYKERRGRPHKQLKSNEYDNMTVEEKLRYKEMECNILKKFHALLAELGEL